jgi:hypothetical protein
VSVAVDTRGETGTKLDRATIGILNVWDPAVNGFVTLQPGVRLRSCRVLRATSTEQRLGYSAEFEVNGRTCLCPLYQFLPRTEVLVP